jgi:hypothetical protein
LKIQFFGIAAVLLSTAVVAQSSALTAAQRIETEVQVRKAGELLAGSLRDPSATLFRNVFVQKTVGRDGKEYLTLCGEVNSKNGYGGMSGFHAFFLGADRVWVGGPGEILNADEICNNGRGVIDTRDYSAELRKAFNSRIGQ